MDVLLQHPMKTYLKYYTKFMKKRAQRWMRRISKVSEFLVWNEIECIGKMQMQAERGGPFEITWE
jgi:hypothetical protein